MIFGRLARPFLLLLSLVLLAGCENSYAPPSSPKPSNPPTPPLTYSNAVKADKPTAYWQLHEALAADATVHDSSGNGNDGVISGSATLVPGALVGIHDQALHFDGHASINVQNPIGLGPNSTLELWVNYAPTTTDVHLLRTSSFDAAKNYRFTEIFIGHPSAEPQSQVRSFSVYEFFSGSSPIIPASSPTPPSTWHYLVLTDDGTTLHFYQDGAPVGSGPANSTPLTPSTDVRAPAIEFGSGVTKDIEEIALYNTVLTPTQIAQHYHIGCGC